MKPGLTEIVYLLDRSGSMGPLTDETIAGYNAFLEQQRALPGEALITTGLFDDRFELLGSGVPIVQAQPLSRAQYYARGATALLDALGKTIDEVGVRLSNTPEWERPSKVLFAIATDGQENSSTEYTYEQIRERIMHQRDVYSWEFLFMGANIDVVAEAMRLGMCPEQAMEYVPTPLGVLEMNIGLQKRVTAMRRREMARQG